MNVSLPASEETYIQERVKIKLKFKLTHMLDCVKCTGPKTEEAFLPKKGSKKRKKETPVTSRADNLVLVRASQTDLFLPSL